MKMSETKIARKWREYVGPKDERLEAESAKVYKTGFLLLAFGMLVVLIYQMMAQQVAWVHDMGNASYSPFENTTEVVLYAWLVVVSVVCVIMQTRKGYVDTNRFAQTETFPLGYFSLISGVSGVVSMLVIAAMRCIAEFFLEPFDGVYWGGNLACGVFFGVIIFAATLCGFYLSFRAAKKSRQRIESKLDE